jgi:nitric oxide reductase NorD protein
MPTERASDTPSATAQSGAAAMFAGITRTLECYAAGFDRGSGSTDEASESRPIRISIDPNVSTESGGAPPHTSIRTSISAGTIRVAHVSECDGLAGGRLYEASVAHALAHLRYSRHALPIGKRGQLRIAVASLIEDARVERLLMREYPGLRSLWGTFHSASWEQGALTFASLAARLARALHDPSYVDPNHWVCKGRELVEAIAPGADDLPAYEEVADILAVDLAQMRVRFDASSYRVEPLYRDDNTYLWATEVEPEHARIEQAPSALDQATAQPDTMDSPVEQDDTPPSDVTLRAHRYPEWHARVGLLFDDWTCVYDRERTSDTAYDGDGDVATRKEAASRRAPPRWWHRPAERLRGRIEGDELDLGAIIDYGVAQRIAAPHEGKVFLQKRRVRPSMSVLLLLDFSASTGDPIDALGTTVLDVEKEAAAAVATALDSTSTRIALHGFASNGRNDVRYLRIKDFDEPFGEAQRRQLHAQRGAFSTRMGAALRHAATQFDDENSEAKVLMLVTDGEPSDVDVHDSSHLIEDARHAVSGLSARGILPFCFALDREADRYVRKIFGSDRSMVLSGVTNLASHVSKVIGSLL